MSVVVRLKVWLFCVKQRSCKHCFKNEWTLVNNFNDILQNYHRNSTVSGHVSVTSDSDPFDYDMSNRAQLPKGIEKIRPHLERYHSYITLAQNLIWLPNFSQKWDFFVKTKEFLFPRYILTKFSFCLKFLVRKEEEKCSKNSWKCCSW